MKLKYEKPYIELVNCENSNFMSGSNKGKWHYTREIGGEVFDYYSDERENSNWEKMWNGYGMHGHLYDPNGNEVYSKKNNLWE